jgi:PilZ domain-containing protein
MSSVAQQRASDNRSRSRVRALMAGRIVFNKGRSSVDCVVRNITDAGAKLSVSAAANVPDQFELVLPHKRTTRRARLVWRRLDEIGVAFSDAPLPHVDSSTDGEAALRRRIQQLEAEVARLQAIIEKLSDA